MRKKLAAFLLCALLVFQMAVPPARAANTVYFVVAGVEVQPISDQTMPFWSGGYLYIPASLFTGAARKTLGISCGSSSQTVILYSGGDHSLIFDLNKGLTQDSEGNIITTKTYVKINDYAKLRHLFGELLAEIQRIKSEGDFEAARLLVEKYAVNIDPELHREILARYKKLNLAPYKGFINPKMTLELDEEGEITDVVLDYEESYVDQMLRYSDEYGTL